LRAEAGRVRGHHSLLDLARRSPDVLAAATPCWALSPLTVPEVLAPGQTFDVVVVDEASQLSAAEAVPALSRARQVVVVGDDRQLRPARWTVAVEPDGSEPESQPGEGADSLLDMLAPVLPVARLRTHYRALDEALVAFANEHLYDGGLLTVPAAGAPASAGDESGGSAAVRLDLVQGTGVLAPGADAVESTDAEVARVVELVLKHARTRPRESLGVVTLGHRHADNVREALRLALAEAPELAVALDRGRASGVPEPLLIKSVDEAQGDTRDAVLLTVGFGRTPHGRVLHRFGPLSEPGGERRLAVATTRARRRMTVVASFGPEDLDPARLSGEGPRLLRELLAYAAAGGPAVAAGSEPSASHGSAAGGGPANGATSDGRGFDQADSEDAASDGSAADRSALDGAASDRTASDREVAERDAAERAVSEQAASGRAAAEQSASNRAQALAAAERVAADDGALESDAPDALLRDLADRLRAEGLRVVERYGASAVPVDLAVGEDGGPLLIAVEGDGPAYAATTSTRDRDRLRVQHLERLGWTHLRLWSTDVFRDPAREVARVVAVVRAAAGRERRRRAGALLPDVSGWQNVRWDLDRPPVPARAQQGVRSGIRPAVRPGLPVEAYTDAELDAVVAWIRADTLSRSSEQVAALARQYLGFRRRSARVDAALDAAIARVADTRRPAEEPS